jgi:hypothetical protein
MTSAAKTSGRACVFCGESRLTREHCWPQWLHTHPVIAAKKAMPFPRRPHVSPRTTRGRLSEQPVVEAVIRGEEQPPHLLTVRVVCEDCNTGWMASREGVAKTLFNPLLADDPATLSGDDLRRLSAWATKTAMMFEYCQPEGRAFTDK